MDTKRIALVAVFSALTVVLSPGISRISIPSPFFGLPYQVWEIPIFVAFLSVGPKPGLFLAGVGSLMLLAFQPTIIAVGGIIACFATLFGFYLAYKLVTRNVPDEANLSTKKTVAAVTVGGIIFRTAVMAVQNYYMLPLAGFNMSQSYLLGVVIPLVAVFNITEPLYVIPISYFVAKAICLNHKIGSKLQSARY
jgi:riboflavin transporter FmnP